MLPKKERLIKKEDIKSAIKQKEFEGRAPLLSLVGRKNQQKFSRVVVIASKRMGKAVRRNKIRRVICEAFDKVKDNIKTAGDIVIFPTNKVFDVKFTDIVDNLKFALSKIK